MVAAALFVIGIMLLRAPATARTGNLVAALGMLIALVFGVVATHLHHTLLLAGLFVIAGVAGAVVARRVRMTAMPQLVALFNGMGGGAAALVALDVTLKAVAAGSLSGATSIPGFFTLIIGSVSFAGSLIAFAKLQEILSGRPMVYPGQHLVNGGVLLVILVASVLAVAGGIGAGPTAIGVALVAALLGVLFVLPVGGADMPVIISFLNSLTGLAAAATGFVLQNDLLIVAGALVGASGTILTLIMSRAMHRSLANVLFGGFGQVRQGSGPALEGSVHPTTADEVAMLLAYSQRVVIVPGYGMAVARAQQEVRDLMDRLLARGVDVRFGIHPVAGRMPGHMNVLLAEANVPYDRLYEMEVINPEFSRTDVVLVIGANDVTNPAARTNPGSPIYGMPVLNVDQAKTVVVLKRSMAPGFAGIDNDLFLMDKTLMLFGDARASVAALVQELREAV
ncbi:MAG: NAD(P)(+) transhydrogenase (Re/Si-specific) subunit beta [Firmicutes bacterium]|nr:NAD(P)(+) transhydrogenase (Re/Si-specific) subunit beta [Bacillota bacterium]